MSLKVFIKSIWLMLFISPVLSFGQIASDGEELAKVNALAELLQLSPEQTTTFTTVLRQHGKASAEAMSRHADDLPGLRKSIKDVQQTQDEAVELLISGAQYKMYLVEIKKDRAERRRMYLNTSRAKSE